VCGAEDRIELSGNGFGTGQINAFVDDLVVFTAFENNSVEVNDRINRIQRAVLPLIYFRQDFIGDFRNQCLRNLCSVNLTQVVLNVALTHAFGVHRQYFLLNLVSPGLTSFKNFRLELAIAIARNNNFAFAVIANDRLAVVSVAAVSAVGAFSTVSLIALMLVHLSFKHLLNGSREQPFKFRLYIARALAILHQQGYQFHLFVRKNVF